MSDEITQKHLNRARVRGVPSCIPGVSGIVGTYGYKEVQRQTVRALALELGREFTLAEVRAGAAKLAQLAVVQGLTVLEGAMLAVEGDPMEVVPHELTWLLMLPVRGPAKADQTVGVTVGRVHGGSYLETTTTEGLPALGNVYTYFLGHLLPQRSQQLTRAIIYHRIVDGLEQDEPAALTLEIYVPFSMTLREPLRLVTREEI